VSKASKEISTMTATDSVPLHALAEENLASASPDLLRGGGSCAGGFRLGCLRALYDRDSLGRVGVVSGVSGGFLLAVLWAYGPTEFGGFDVSATDLLRCGL
jgi:hypothetical protein